MLLIAEIRSGIFSRDYHLTRRWHGMYSEVKGSRLRVSCRDRTRVVCILDRDSRNADNLSARHVDYDCGII